MTHDITIKQNALDIAKNINHIAVIMDGNGRWAKEKSIPRIEGHRRGAQSVLALTEACMELNIKNLTIYAFSSENWNRPQKEVTGLMNLLKSFLKKKTKEIHEKNISLKAIGNLKALPNDCYQKLQKSIDLTKKNTALNLILALSYGAREEITKACKNIAQDCLNKKITTDEITEKTFSKYLYTANIPDPDFLIRTSGEMRISNFLLWQISYAEIIVLKKNWPDFRKNDLYDAIIQYGKRHRRFGKI